MAYIPAPPKYAQAIGQADLTFDALCKVLSGRAGQADWGQFGPAEWRLLAQMAEAEGVGPLLYWKLKPGGSGQWGVGSPDAPAPGWHNGRDANAPMLMPEATWRFLQASYYKTAAQNAVLLHELERILAAFEQAGIPVVVLKGAALLRAGLYPDPGLRPMNDLDLLVPPEDLGASIRLLKKLGFGLWKMTYHAMLVGGAAQPLSVELHWCLMGGGPHGAAAQPQALFGPWGYAADDLTAQFVYLAAHLAYQHRSSSRLIWVYDLFAILQQAQAQAEQVRQKAADLGWQAALGYALGQVQALFGETLAPVLGEGAADLDAESLPTESQVNRNWTRQAFGALPMRARRAWLQGFLFPAPEYLKWRYQIRRAWLWPLYLPRRWWELSVSQP